MVDPSDLPARFRVLETLHRDAMQVRLLVVDTVLNTEAVLELPGADRLRELDRGDQRQRIRREARSLAKVRHPGVQAIRDLIEHRGVPMLVLEPCTGRTLADVLAERGTLEPDEVRRIGIEVARAAHAVHEQGVVHRDVQAANVVLRRDGSCVLTGFGFAKPQGTPFDLSSIDHAKGRASGAPDLPAHPAPEQLRGKAADARSDVYALGCMLLRCLCGEAPKPGEAPEPDAVRAAARPAPRTLIEVIARCLAAMPAARFPTMREVADALAPETAAVPRLSRRRLVLATVATVIAVPLGLWLADLGARRGTPAPPPGERGRPADSAIQRVRSTGWYRSSHALVIGVDYKDAAGKHAVLTYAERDARAVANALRALGWKADHVKELLGPQATCDAIRTELWRLQDKLRVDPEDQVFVYFAGHGKLHGNTQESGWVLPYDAGPNPGPDAPPQRWLPYRELHEMLNHQVPAGHVLLALDCCHSGAGMKAPAGRRGDATISRADAAAFIATDARIVLAASAAEQQASDDSWFTRTLLECIALEGDRCVTATQIFGKMQAVPSAGHTPVYFRYDTSGVASDFVFGRRPE
jgi:hypothetical protein